MVQEQNTYSAEYVSSVAKSFEKKTRKKTSEDYEYVFRREAKIVLNNALLPITTPENLYDHVQPPSTIYYRVYRRGNEYAVFLIYEWDKQVLPPHKHDYEPVVVFLEKEVRENDYGEKTVEYVVKEVYVDGYHYIIHRYRKPPMAVSRPHIRIETPWRSMSVSWSDYPKNYILVYPVDEKKGSTSPTKIKYLSKKTLMALKSRRINPLSINEELINNPWLVKRAKHWTTINDPTLDDILRDLGKNYGISRLDLYINKLKTFVKSLSETLKVTLKSTVSKIREKISGENKDTLYNLVF